MHKEKIGNHMEDNICLGVFIVSMIIQKLILRMHKSCIVSFVIKKYVIWINLRIQTRKRLIFYYKTNGITLFLKHADVKHIIIAKMFEEEIKSLLKRREERQPTKKRTWWINFQFFFAKNSFKKKDVP